MNEKQLIEPIEIEVGQNRFQLSKIPAIAGREILINYAGDGKGDPSDDSSATVLKMLSFCSINIGGNWVCLSTPQLIDSHLSGAENLMLLEKKMLEYNFGFFGAGGN